MMANPVDTGIERRVLISAPSGQDSKVLSELLGGAGYDCTACATPEVLCRFIQEGAAVSVLADEVLLPGYARRLLSETLAGQPEWSDFPLVVLGASKGLPHQGWQLLGEVADSTHAILLQRPVRKISLLTTIHAAVQSRLRQYQVRDEFARRKNAEETLGKARDELEVRVAERTDELHRRARDLSRLVSELTLTEGRERRRISAILHDHVQQLVVSSMMKLDVLARRAGPMEREQILEVRTRLAEAVEISRSLSVELAPPILHDSGLAAGIQWLARWMNEKYGLEVTRSLDPEANPVSTDVRMLLFESVRELLFNVVKHSGVNRAKVELAMVDEDNLRVTVSDAGTGFPSDTRLKSYDTRSGFGLLSIRERLRFIGGSFEIESEPGQGARVILTAPCKRNMADDVPAESDTSAGHRKPNDPGAESPNQGSFAF